MVKFKSLVNDPAVNSKPFENMKLSRRLYKRIKKIIPRFTIFQISIQLCLLNKNLEFHKIFFLFHWSPIIFLERNIN